MSLTIGGASVSGVPGVALQGGDSSAIYVNLGTDYADYSVQVGVPTGDAWAQVLLYDVDGTPFQSDALPLEIPQPYETFFPGDSSFSLRQPGSSTVVLRGVVGSASPVVEPGAHTKVRADFHTRVDTSGDLHLDLLWGVTGEEAIS